MHFDAISNFFTQLVGRKRVLIFSPAQSYLLYPYPMHHPMDTYAMADVERPDLQRLPGLARARGLDATLGPGDVLFLPSFYWHYVRQLDEGSENLSLNTWVGAKPDGSTILGGRVDAFQAKQDALSRSARPTIEDVVKCTHAAAATAARLSRLSRKQASASEAMALAPTSPTSPISAAEIADDRLFADDDANGLHSLITARWVEEEGARYLRDAGIATTAEEITAKLGQFLNAMAAGDDDCEKLQGRGVRPDAPIGLPGSPTHNAATKLRLDLIASLGGETTSALLRSLTRHGRLYPGIAPTIEGEVVNSEKGGFTPVAQVPAVVVS